ncbi:MAG: flagellar biosynthetic protein FliR [Melioribacteraceae bacterium]|nr:flagellar biosynthetic protein FliR [Melioribacteraceae bacterium]
MSDILITDFLIVFLIFMRILSAMIAAPIYGHSAVPVVTKVLISFIIAFIIFSSIDTSGIVIEFNPWWILLNAGKEIITGLIIGFTLNFIFYGISFAGHIMGFEIGLAMATVFNPVEETSSNVIGQLVYLLAIMIFFIINGHHYVIRALTYSVQVMPLGTVAINESVSDLLVKYSAAVFILAVKIAAPIMVSYVLINIAEGILARVVPQMQVFFVTYPVKLGVGFLILMLLTPLYLHVIKNLLYDFEEKLYLLVKAMGS